MLQSKVFEFLMQKNLHKTHAKRNIDQPGRKSLYGEPRNLKGLTTWFPGSFITARSLSDGEMNNPGNVVEGVVHFFQ